MIRSAILIVALAAPLAAQPAPRPAVDTALFTVDDALDVVTVGASDLTDDGRWLAAITASRRDALGADFSRDGDPSYVAPRKARVWVIDTQAGERRAVFPGPENVKAPAWSPDGRALALATPGRVVVVDAVSGRAEVYVDGGIRTGVDVVKALALGARAVMIGRPVLWGLCVGGAAGAAQVLELLGTEMNSALAFCGAASVEWLTRDLVVRR